MSENDDFDLYGDLEGFVDISDPQKLPKGSESQQGHDLEIDDVAYQPDFEEQEEAQYEEFQDVDEGDGNINADGDFEEELQVQIDDGDEDDDVVFLVDEDDAENDTSGYPKPNVTATYRTKKTRIWSSKFVPRERTCYVGAPLILSGEPHRDCMCIVGGVPWYIDQDGLCKFFSKTSQPCCVCFCSNPLNGVSLGVALLEFASASACREALGTTKCDFSIKRVDESLFELLCDGRYRTGVLPLDVQGEICAQFGIAAGVGLTGTNVSVAAKELEFEQQQLQMIQCDDYKHATEAFPWFNINLVPLLGQYRRVTVSQSILGQQGVVSNANGSDDACIDDEDLTSHLQAYKRAAERHVNANVQVEQPKLVVSPLQQQHEHEQEPLVPQVQQQQQHAKSRRSTSPLKRLQHGHKRSKSPPRSSSPMSKANSKSNRNRHFDTDSKKRHRHHKSSSTRSRDSRDHKRKR